MTNYPDNALVCRHSVLSGLPVLTVSGTLTHASSPQLYNAATRVLRQDRMELLLDVSAMLVAAPQPVAVFNRIMNDALRWPDVLVLVCAPNDEVATLLKEPILDRRLVMPSVDAGHIVASMLEAPVSETLLPVTGAGRRARDVVTEACLRWGEPQLIGPATAVANELVVNAAEHARTMMTLQVQLRRCHIHLAVFDGSTAPARLPTTQHDNHHGHGLRLVDAYSVLWGSTPLPSGKVVWSAIKRPAR